MGILTKLSYILVLEREKKIDMKFFIVLQIFIMTLKLSYGCKDCKGCRCCDSCCECRDFQHLVSNSNLVKYLAKHRQSNEREWLWPMSEAKKEKYPLEENEKHSVKEDEKHLVSGRKQK